MSETYLRSKARKAVERHFFDWAYLDCSDPHLALGDRFRSEVGELLSARDFHVENLEEFFLRLSPDDLKAACGEARLDNFADKEAEIKRLCDQSRQATSFITKTHLVAIGVYPEVLADFEAWAMRDSFYASELVWLSIGLEPTDALNKDFKEFRAGRGRMDVFLGQEIHLRLETVNRSQELAIFNQGATSAVRAFRWLNSVRLDVPQGFRDMLQTASARLEARSVPSKVSQPVDGRKPDIREMKTMARLITAIAINEYGYSPTAKRSPIPGEIEDICDKLGLSVSRETILKYLRMGARELPEDGS